MITISASQAIGYIILTPIALVVVLMAATSLIRIYKRYAKSQEQSKLYKSMMKKVEEMKAKGDFHEWIPVPFSPTETVYACKSTGYVPSKEGFFPLSHIKDILRQKEEKEAYAAFKNEKLLEIAKSFGLKMDEMDSIVNEIIAIPQEYAVEKLQVLEDELKTKAAEIEASLK